MKLGKIQKAIIDWIGEDTIYIGARAIPPQTLAGYTYDEIKPSLDRLIERKFIEQCGRSLYRKKIEVS